MKTKLIIIIPCYNEEKTIGQVIDLIPRKIKGIAQVQVIVVNDGSTDNSAKIAKEHGAVIITHKKNQGLGQTFRDGMQMAVKLGAHIIVNMDADLQFDPADVAKLVAPIVNEEADFVTAPRYKDYLDYNLAGRGIKNHGNKFFAWLISGMVGQKFSDVSCGFRAYSREVALRLQIFGHFTYTHETFLDIAHKKFIIQEVAVKVRPQRAEGKSKISGNLAKYGYSAIKIIVRGFRDHEPLQFFGLLGSMIMATGVFFGVLLASWYVYSGELSPYKTFGFVSGFLLAFGFLVIVLGLMADMMGRIKDLEEEILYRLKK